jgi:hypothetical protein
VEFKDRRCIRTDLNRTEEKLTGIQVYFSVLIVTAGHNNENNVEVGGDTFRFM